MLPSVVMSDSSSAWLTITRCDAAACSRAERRKQTLSWRMQPAAACAAEDSLSQGAAAFRLPRLISARSPVAVVCSHTSVLASRRASSAEGDSAARMRFHKRRQR